MNRKARIVAFVAVFVLVCGAAPGYADDPDAETPPPAGIDDLFGGGGEAVPEEAAPTPPPPPPPPLKFYIASSAAEATRVVVQRFKAETGIVVEVTAGSSAQLAKQIVDGEAADLFLSADQANADLLAEYDLVAKRRTLLKNRLVLIVPARSSLDLHGLADLARDDVKQVAVVNEGISAGDYTRDALRKAGVWEKVAGKIVGAEDTRNTLGQVERGAPAGIVYLTDAATDRQVRIVAEIDVDAQRPIEYPLVMVKRDLLRPDAVTHLFDYLCVSPASIFFEGFKFEVVP